MKKWNTSITFESHEEVVGVLSALEKYKGEYIPDGVEKLIGKRPIRGCIEISGCCM